MGYQQLWKEEYKDKQRVQPLIDNYNSTLKESGISEDLLKQAMSFDPSDFARALSKTLNNK